MDEYIVVGSGPAGVSAAKALLKNDKKVLMLDAGKELPAEQARWASTLRKKHPASWTARRSSDALRKRKFDSGYMYDTPGLEIAAGHARVSASFARGGLSSVWGAAMLPYEKSDMKSWPDLDLAPYYRRVLSFVPLAGAADALASRFPLFGEPEELQASAQSEALLAHCERHEASLGKSGFAVGRSRLAVWVLPEKEQSGCVYCGLCMSGCLYDLVYSAGHTLEELLQNKNFSYERDVVVSHLEEKNGVPEVHASRLGKDESYPGTKVFLATGVFSTAQIMLRSTKEHGVSIRDSQHLIIPCLVKKQGSAGHQHALSQVFMEYQDEELGNVHMQFYPFSDLIEQAVADKLGVLYRVLKPLLAPLVKRLVVIQAFLHSDVSGALQADLTDSGLAVEGSPNPQGKKLPRVLLRHAGKLGFLPVLPLVEYGLPGQGFHSGGSFPMSDTPRTGESDVLGRCGFENIHIVDSSVLPSIAGTTITLTEMANAYRIADTVSRRTA